MSLVLLVAEHSAGIVSPAALAAVSACSQLGPVTALVVGDRAASAAKKLAMLDGIERVLVAEDASAALEMPESLAPFVAELCRSRNYTHVATAATAFGRMILPRVAAMLDVGQVSDVIRIEDDATFIRPMYAGNVIVRVRCRDSIRVVTFRAAAFSQATDRPSGEAAVVERVDGGVRDPRSRLLARTAIMSERPQLVGARVIVSGGRGMGSTENFKLLDPIAAKLGAAIGASRAAVDAGFVPNDYQVGQTGKCVAPDLYIAIGISGAVQHLAGMKDSKCIVAVNKDPDAPIFSVADYGLVADLFDVLSELDRALDTYVVGP